MVLLQCLRNINIKELLDFDFYSRHFLKIQTKVDGLQPFRLRKYQRRFVDFVNNIDGPKRVIILKPRQAGFSTLCSGYLSHKLFTEPNFSGLSMADQYSRTKAMAGLYNVFYDSLPDQLKPGVRIKNSEQIIFDVFKSVLDFATANDPNAGKSASRLFAHLSEFAFYRYANEIDESVQNSIPLVDNSYIFKESTANGKAGIGKPFFDLWNAAKRGESIYKPFFVSWFEIDDYTIKPSSDFKITQFEKKLVKANPGITEGNLFWRRLKVQEYMSDETSILAPEERFRQDFPANDIEAFRSTGSPIFDIEQLEVEITKLSEIPAKDIKHIVKIDSQVIKNFWEQLKIYSPPRKNRDYFIGADVAEGLAIGDASSVSIIDESYGQVASWHGKIDPDLFGFLLVALAELFNNAVLIPEINNMGHTTLNSIRNEGYSKVYREVIEDKITKEKTTKLGWRTTAKSKDIMLNHFVKLFRENDTKIKDKNLLVEMSLLSRGENGIVKLNGRDRTVAHCLACMGRKSTRLNIRSKHNQTPAEILKELTKKKKDKDMFG